MTACLPIGDEPNLYKTLLESTRAIPWKIDWATMTFAYIGPQIETLLGWRQDSWLTIEDWATRMHPDDRQWVVDFCVSQSKEGVDHEADYRVLKADGDYVWVRDVVHVVRKADGDVDCLVGFMFDITERKKSEEQLLRLQRELEEMSFQDGLTGVANRRLFDSALAREWARACRYRRPLSLLLIDVDHFKQFNDCYGHIQGDDCLKRVAGVLNGAGTRAADLFARFGGEEFALLLPETAADAAARIADRCRQAMLREGIEHRGSSVSDVVTISIGAGTVVPGRDDEVRRFINQVDRQLYKAKKAGRNCIRSSAQT